MKRASIMLMVTLVVACQPSAELSPPPFGDATSAVLIAVENGEEFAFAVEKPSDGTLELPPIVQRDDLELYAMSFTCPLVSVGVDAGSIPVASMPLSKSLVEPDTAFFANLPRDGNAAWSAAPSEKLDDLRSRIGSGLGDCSRSAWFGMEKEILLPVNAVDYFAFSFVPEAGRAVFGSIAGNFYQVTADGDQSRLRLEVPSPLGSVHAAADGKTYGIDQLGQIYAGDFDDGFQRLTTVTGSIRATIMDLDGPPANRTDAPIELFAADDLQRFMRFDGTTTVLLSVARSGGVLLPQVAWIAPGEAVTIGHGEGDELTRYRGGQLTHEALPTGGRLTSVVRHRTLGLVVGTDRGEIFIQDGDVWSMIGDTDGANLRLIELGEGLWSSTLNGVFPPRSRSQFLSSFTPLCEVEEEMAGLTVDMVEVEPGTFFIVTQRSFTESFFVTRVMQQRNFSRCRGG